MFTLGEEEEKQGQQEEKGEEETQYQRQLGAMEEAVFPFLPSTALASTAVSALGSFSTWASLQHYRDV